jgi:hypothetical protein
MVYFNRIQQLEKTKNVGGDVIGATMSATLSSTHQQILLFLKRT